jgi:hypothetical protein
LAQVYDPDPLQRGQVPDVDANDRVYHLQEHQKYGFAGETEILDLPTYGAAYKGNIPGFETLLLPEADASNEGAVFVDGSNCTSPSGLAHPHLLRPALLDR